MNVNDKWKPHRTQEMTKWESSIITLIATARFGQIRQCVHCEAEEAKTACGHKAHEELNFLCEELPEIMES